MTPTIEHWQRGDAYERYMGRWSRLLAPAFLQWLAAPAGSRWVDVGCGTGALSEAIVALCAPAAVSGVDPSEGFLAMAKRRLPARLILHQGVASELPLADAAVDLAVCSLVLNFVPDSVAALREMARVTTPGGRVAACVWDYAGKMDLTRRYWNAAAQLGLLAPGQDQGERFPICRPEALACAFGAAGLRQVELTALETPMRFVDFDDYWGPFLGGQGPAPAHLMSLAEPVRARLREHLRESLPVQAGGTILLGARAWAAQGRVANRSGRPL
jgi:SAM-dependent methyltransferase